jgi:hypothetical protein
MTVVYLFEIVEPYEPSYGERIFSTLEKAKASVPHVEAWKAGPDGVVYEDHNGLRSYYHIKPMTVDEDRG